MSRTEAIAELALVVVGPTDEAVVAVFGRHGDSVEKFRVASRADQDGCLSGELKNQQPTTPEVTLAVVLDVSNELMIAAVRRQRRSRRQQRDDFSKPAQIAPGALDALDALLELLCENKLTHQIPRAALASSAER